MLDAVNELAEEVFRLTKAEEYEQARGDARIEIEPALVDATTSINHLTNILGGEAKQTSGRRRWQERWAAHDLLSSDPDRRNHSNNSVTPRSCISR